MLSAANIGIIFELTIKGIEIFGETLKNVFLCRGKSMFLVMLKLIRQWIDGQRRRHVGVWHERMHSLYVAQAMAFTSLCSPCIAATHWVIEAESAATRIVARGDTLDITSPKGLSLWWDTPLVAPCVIEYDACVVMKGGPCDRLSDLNCFWMASEPLPASSTASGQEAAPYSTPLRHIAARGGSFVESYRLQCYYLGYGGNGNTTTRFRRYDADTLGVTDVNHRPPVLVEYTDSAHLLRPNHWYHVRIEVTADGRSRYMIDDRLLVDYLDPAPLLRGWFAFRTTWSHIRLANFKIQGTR